MKNHQRLFYVVSRNADATSRYNVLMNVFIKLFSHFFVETSTVERRDSVAASVFPTITPAFVDLGAIKGWFTKPLVDRVMHVTHPLGEVLTRLDSRWILLHAAHATTLHG